MGQKNKIGIEARGRNGWFKAASSVVSLSFTGVNEPENVTVSIYSRQRGEFAPIYFAGPRSLMVDLFTEILAGVQKVGSEDKGLIEINIEERGK